VRLLITAAYGDAWLSSHTNSPLEGKVAFLPISDLATNPRNARTHSPRQIQEIARSIERFGFNNPVLIDERNQIIAGHGRVEAAKLLGRKGCRRCASATSATRINAPL
jgi:ParB-like nuclease domain